jgi:hypothetical protein
MSTNEYAILLRKASRQEIKKILDQHSNDPTLIRSTDFLNSEDQSSSWEATSFSTSQEIPRISGTRWFITGPVIPGSQQPATDLYPKLH